jgi:hypothetical protein
MNLMPDIYTVQVYSLKTTTAKNEFNAKKCLKWAHTLCERAFVCVTSVRYDTHLFIVTAKC